MDAVDQAALLADALEQARGHAAAEQRRIDGHGVVVRIAVADALAAEHEMDLLERARLAAVAADIGHRHRQLGIGRRAFDRTEMAHSWTADGGVLDPARRAG